MKVKWRCLNITNVLAKGLPRLADALTLKSPSRLTYQNIKNCKTLSVQAGVRTGS